MKPDRHAMPLLSIDAAELKRLLDHDQRYLAMCARLGDCARRHGVDVMGDRYIDQVIIDALDDAAGL